MSVCGRIQSIFEKPLPENPTLLQSLSSSSWKPIEQPSFTEIFGELHFNENITLSQSPSSTFKVFSNPQTSSFKLFGNSTNDENDITSLSLPSKNHLNSESLQLCTEGLGFESSDDVEDMKNEMNQHSWESKENNKPAIAKIPTLDNLYGELKRSRGGGVNTFPPPISCIGKSGKPYVCFKSYREDGRFVLKQVKIPTQEFLHACREDGRLRLQFVQPNDDDEVSEDDEFDEEEDDDDVSEDDEFDEEEDDDDVSEDDEFDEEEDDDEEEEGGFEEELLSDDIDED